MRHVEALMRQAVAEGVFPGGAVWAARDGVEVLSFICGTADLSSGRPIRDTTCFDLASLTKPLATALAVLLLVQEERIKLDQALAGLLPGYGDNPKGKITVRQLLSHRSGLPAYRPYYRRLVQIPAHRRREGLDRLLDQEPLAAPPGSQTVYSDLGFMLLRRVVEHIGGVRLDRFVAQRIFRPLGLRDLFFVDLGLAIPERDFAATEDCPWRGCVVEGGVHDENAFAAGGIDGHAGLFGTATAVGGIVSELLAAHGGTSARRLIDTQLLRCFLQPAVPGGKALGFDTRAERDSSSGRWFSRQSVGHLGFTGTSFWIDLERGISVVLLTNRIHPTCENRRIQAFRPCLHDAVMEGVVAGG